MLLKMSNHWTICFRGVFESMVERQNAGILQLPQCNWCTTCHKWIPLIIFQIPKPQFCLLKTTCIFNDVAMERVFLLTYHKKYFSYQKLLNLTNWTFKYKTCSPLDNSISLAASTALGVSFDCCAPIFCGTKPVSEPEAQAVTYFVGNRKEDFLCFLTIHSYSKMLLVPFGNPNFTASNYDELVFTSTHTMMHDLHMADYEHTQYILNITSHNNSGFKKSVCATFVPDYRYINRENKAYCHRNWAHACHKYTENEAICYSSIDNGEQMAACL